MIIKVKVRVNSGKQEIEKIGDNEYGVSLKSIPEDNKANLELLKLLRKYFRNREVTMENIKIIKGLKSRNKVVEIN